jgi:hypothetical protein
MRTIDFETILAQSIQACGLDRNNVNDETFAQFRDFANNRIRFAWEYDVWPDLIRTTKFPVTANGDIYSIVIPSDGIVTNNEGTFKIDIGTILQVTVEDPRTTGKVKDVGFTFDEYDQQVNGNVWTTVKRLIIDNKTISNAYVTYRVNHPELVGELWKAGTYYPSQSVYWAYANNSYFAPTSGAMFAGKKGNFWKCLNQTTTAPNPNNSSIPLSTDNWEKVKIPLFLANYIIKGCHADWLKSELQVELGFALDKEAQSLLDYEVQKIIIQQGQAPRIKFNQIY